LLSKTEKHKTHILKKIKFILICLLTISAYSQNEKLIGKWANCESVCNGVTVNKNVCPDIEFKSDQTVSVSMSGKNIENYTWKIENSQIIFKNVKPCKSSTFSESKPYDLEFNESANVLKILEIENKNCYDLLLK
jgi:hypothetical protein